MSRDDFYGTLNEAVEYFCANGFGEPETLQHWIERIRIAADRSMLSTRDAQAALDRALRTVFQRTMRGGYRRAHARAIDVQQIQPELRRVLRQRIVASADLIRLHREQNIVRILQRFSGWASSIPPGGSRSVEKREVKEGVMKAFRSLSFEERRLSIDQGHKLVAAINRTIGEAGGAIAIRWHHVHQANYNARPEHVERDGKIYILRESWARDARLVKRGGHPWYEEIDPVATLPYCRCFAEFLYSLEDLPDEYLTRRGKKEVARGR